jgi:glucokinase
LNIAYIDWGGTHFRCVIEGGSEPLSFSKPSQNIDIIFELKSIFDKFPHISKVGISFAGQVQNNRIISAPNIEAKELDLNAYFGGEKKIIVQNDLKCAAIAEATYHKETNIAALYVGTGIGSAYINDGRLVGGCANMAGEIGHIPYRKSTEVCGCGKDNCLELTASGSGIIKSAEAAGLDARTIDELLKSEVGANIAREFAAGVGYAASLIVTMLNPKILVLGGGIISSNKWLLEHTKDYVAKNAFNKNVHSCEVKISTLQNGSLEGARLLAL